MIFYLTATGNSKYAAERLLREFPGELIDITEAARENRYEYDVKDEEIVFFVFPIWYYGIPHQIDDFVRKVDFKGKKPIIAAVGTCGSSSGSADVMIRRALQESGYELKGFFQLIMPENYLAMFKVPLREEQIMILRRADKAIDELVTSIRFNFRLTHKSTYTTRFLSWFAHKIYVNGRPAKKFYADENCIGCGLCKDVCIDEIIEMEDGKPKWTNDRCSHCMGCISRCPKEAIQYGKVTQKRVRYVNSSLK